MRTKISNDHKEGLVCVAVRAIKEIDPELTIVQIRKVFSYGYGIYSRRVDEYKNDLQQDATES